MGSAPSCPSPGHPHLLPAASLGLGLRGNPPSSFSPAHHALLQSRFFGIVPTMPAPQTLGTLGWLPGSSESLCSKLRCSEAWHPISTPGPRDALHMPGGPAQHRTGRSWPHQPAAESGEGLVLPVDRMGSGSASSASHPHVIVTFDLSQQPIGRGLGGQACGAGRKGLCPCRPLTKYRNGRG